MRQGKFIYILLQRWRCGGCNQEGTEGGPLADHVLQTHTRRDGFGRIICTCGMSFIDLYNYVRHYMNEHTVSIHVCGACGQGYTAYTACWMHTRGCN